jgi:hypothetical protein
MSYDLLDNFLPPELEDYYELLVLGSIDGKKLLDPVVPISVKYEPTFKDFDYTMFIHILKDSGHFSEFCSQFAVILNHYCMQNGLVLIDVNGARIHLQPANSSVQLNSDSIESHIDNEMPHLVGLYFINDAGGDFRLIKDGEEIPIKPRKGRLVVFDGRLYHKAGFSTTGTRAAVNFNFRAMRHDERKKMVEETRRKLTTG